MCIRDRSRRARPPACLRTCSGHWRALGLRARASGGGPGAASERARALAGRRAARGPALGALRVGSLSLSFSSVGP
eukprot:2875437-Alexandrium_andersonii.AAC.1